MQIRAVLGTIDSAELGFTLTHEHIGVISPGLWRTWPELMGGREEFIARSAARYREAAEACGLRTVVDVTTIDLGRDIEMIAEVSRRSGVNFIACTGHHLSPSGTILSRTVDELAWLFQREIDEGIDGTPIRAGIIKVAHDVDGVTPFGERLLQAAARAQRATGVPIMAHSYSPGQVGNAQLTVLVEEGVDPGRVCISHSNDTDDLGYLEGLAAQGAWIGMDRYPGGRVGGLRWERRTEVLAELVKRGLAGRILLSHDWVMEIASLPSGEPPWWRENPDHVMFISRRVLPLLRRLGVTEEQITGITVENPRRFFEGQS